MTTDLFANAHSILFAHAHPDDETVSSGALIAELAARGTRVFLVTATRGERGEVVPGPLAALEGTPGLAAHREKELQRAARLLGVTERVWLGEPPARAAGLPARRYEDSGMRWLRPGLAGPAPDTTPEALCSAKPAEVVADLEAAIAAWRPEWIVSYDAAGGYGHPDHVRIAQAARQAARQAGIRSAELVPPPTDGARLGDDVAWFDGEHHRPTVVAALRCHASQLTVAGDDLIHSGGQRQPLRTRVGVRETTDRPESDVSPWKVA